MIFKRWHRVMSIGIPLGILCFVSLFFLFPHTLLSVQEKQTPPPAMMYDYYIIVDEIDDHSLMYIPLVVSIGDEIITEGNKLYKVIRVEGNRGIARFIENIDLTQYKKQ